MRSGNKSFYTSSSRSLSSDGTLLVPAHVGRVSPFFPSSLNGTPVVHASDPWDVVLLSFVDLQLI